MMGRTPDRRQSRVSASAWGALCVAIALACACLLSGCAASVPENTAASPQTNSTDLTNEINTTQLPDSSFIYDASIDDLANATSYMNDQTVQVVGEVVGDRITDEYDSSYCWLTLQDTAGSYAEIAIYIPISMTASIDTYGSYSRQGSMLQVRGTFNLACKDHDGVSCLHATHMTKTAPGKAREISPNSMYLSVGAVMLAAGLGLLLAHNRLRERQL